MDLSKLDTVSAAAEGATLHLKHPVTGVPLLDESLKSDEHPDGAPVTITLLGVDSPEYQALDRRLRNRRLAETGRRGAQVKLTAEQIDNEAVQMLAALTVGWQNVGFGETKLEFSREAAASLYKKVPWIREQVDEFVADRGNFLRA